MTNRLKYDSPEWRRLSGAISTLRDHGCTYREIGEELGVKSTRVARIVNYEMRLAKRRIMQAEPRCQIIFSKNGKVVSDATFCGDEEMYKKFLQIFDAYIKKRAKADFKLDQEMIYDV